jgi:hypothetical protein
MPSRVIHIHPDAPAKPAIGQACTGCGVCCMLEPCPLGILLSGSRHGACTALRWNVEWRMYRCGALAAPESVMQNVLPAVCRGLASLLAPFLQRLARRWIAQGQGCDSALQVAHAPFAEESDRQLPP